jgi:hypothetical protein
MGFVSLVRRYKRLNTATGAFDMERTDKEFAHMLGLHPTQISRFFAGHVRDSGAVLRAFVRTFPQAAPEIGPAILAEETGASEASAEAEHAIA